MGRRGPKPRFNDVACPNANCADYGMGSGILKGANSHTRSRTHLGIRKIMAGFLSGS